MRNTAIAMVLGVLLVAAAATASVTFTPPDSSKPVDMATIKLEPQKAAPKASGTASLICNKGNTKHVVTLEAKGLDPKKVYTVRFTKVSGKKTYTAGVGKAPYVLKVDKKGVGKLTYNAPKCPVAEGWQKIEVVEHTDKNPKSTKKLVVVLVGQMPR